MPSVARQKLIGLQTALPKNSMSILFLAGREVIVRLCVASVASVPLWAEMFFSRKEFWCSSRCYSVSSVVEVLARILLFSASPRCMLGFFSCVSAALYYYGLKSSQAAKNLGALLCVPPCPLWLRCCLGFLLFSAPPRYMLSFLVAAMLRCITIHKILLRQIGRA